MGGYNFIPKNDNEKTIIGRNQAEVKGKIVDRYC